MLHQRVDTTFHHLVKRRGTPCNAARTHDHELKLPYLQPRPVHGIQLPNAWITHDLWRTTQMALITHLTSWEHRFHNSALLPHQGQDMSHLCGQFVQICLKFVTTKWSVYLHDQSLYATREEFVVRSQFTSWAGTLFVASWALEKIYDLYSV